jgi:hypothetical protein
MLPYQRAWTDIDWSPGWIYSDVIARGGHKETYKVSKAITTPKPEAPQPQETINGMYGDASIQVASALGAAFGLLIIIVSYFVFFG